MHRGWGRTGGRTLGGDFLPKSHRMHFLSLSPTCRNHLAFAHLHSPYLGKTDTTLLVWAGHRGLIYLIRNDSVVLQLREAGTYTTNLFQCNSFLLAFNTSPLLFSIYIIATSLQTPI